MTPLLNRAASKAPPCLLSLKRGKNKDETNTPPREMRAVVLMICRSDDVAAAKNPLQHSTAQDVALHRNKRASERKTEREKKKLYRCSLIAFLATGLNAVRLPGAV